MTTELTIPPMGWGKPTARGQRGLLVRTAHPLNAETSLPALIGADVAPSHHFYVRNHFPIPALDAADWRLATVDSEQRGNCCATRALSTFTTREA